MSVDADAPLPVRVKGSRLRCSRRNCEGELPELVQLTPAMLAIEADHWHVEVVGDLRIWTFGHGRPARAHNPYHRMKADMVTAGPFCAPLTFPAYFRCRRGHVNVLAQRPETPYPSDVISG